MSTYKETVYQFRILRHEEMSEERKALYRIEGMDPDDIWSLIFSYVKREDAENCLKDLQSRAPSFYTYRLVDAGKADVIERHIW